MAQQPQVQRIEFSVRQLGEMIMDAIDDSGRIPRNLREWALDKEWALRLIPAFKPPEENWEQRTTPYDAGAQIAQSPEQRLIRIGTPFTEEPVILFCAYRAAVMCWRSACEAGGLRWVLEAGQSWYATACEKCNTVSWKWDKELPLFIRIHLANLVDVKRLSIVPDAPNLWVPVFGQGHIKEEEEADSKNAKVILPAPSLTGIMDGAWKNPLRGLL
jgi:hypothetical protein